MIIRFIAFDAGNLATQVKRVLLPIAVVVVLAAVTLPTYAVVGAAVAVVLTVSTAFSTDERGHLDILYGTLPITRSDVVVGRYATLMLLFLVAAVVGNVATFIASAVRSTSVDLDQVALANSAGFVLVAVMLGLQLPFFFAWGFTRASWMRILPLLVILVAAQIASWTGGLAHASSIAAILTHPGLTGLVALVGGAVILVASAIIARALYRRRQL